MKESLEVLLKLLESAMREGDLASVNRINNLIMYGEKDNSGDVAIDEEFIGNIKSKAVYKQLVRIIGDRTASVNEVVKVLSSLITHLSIECESRGNNIKNYPIKVFADKIVKTVELGDVSDAICLLSERYGKYIK